MITINEDEILGKENLENEIFFPLIRLPICFKNALLEDDYEFCEKIKSEMERRERMNLIDKKALCKILDFMDANTSKGDPEQEACFQNFFKQFL